MCYSNQGFHYTKTIIFLKVEPQDKRKHGSWKRKGGCGQTSYLCWTDHMLTNNIVFVYSLWFLVVHKWCKYNIGHGAHVSIIPNSLPVVVRRGLPADAGSHVETTDPAHPVPSKRRTPHYDDFCLQDATEEEGQLAVHSLYVLVICIIIFFNCKFKM